MTSRKTDFALAIVVGAIITVAVTLVFFTDEEIISFFNSSIAEMMDRGTDINAGTEKEVLIFSCSIYLESDREEERYLIGWVIRIRVDTKYLGNSDYGSTIGQKKHFTPFNDSSEKEVCPSPIDDPEEPNLSWQNARRIAEEIYYAPPEDNPLPWDARHFYGPASMEDEYGNPDPTAVPYWVGNHKPMDLPGINPKRLLIFRGIK